MTLPAINAVGFCAHYSQAGDWAFELAVELARRNFKRLNIFHFLADPYDPQDEGPVNLTSEQYRHFLVEREKELEETRAKAKGMLMALNGGVAVVD